MQPALFEIVWFILWNASKDYTSSLNCTVQRCEMCGDLEGSVTEGHWIAISHFFCCYQFRFSFHLVFNSRGFVFSLVIVFVFHSGKWCCELHCFSHKTDGLNEVIKHTFLLPYFLFFPPLIIFTAVVESVRLKVTVLCFFRTCAFQITATYIKKGWNFKDNSCFFFFFATTVADLEVKTREKLEAAKKKTSFEIAELKERLKASRETINCLKSEIRKLEEDDQSKDMWWVLTWQGAYNENERTSVVELYAFSPIL